ncbi:MAG: cytochrome c-type biogenesis protein CcmH, partial [Acidimicrobiia bacterium]|nr:cytochrome c-type biogenesis protein CcmH [Acidimicrobiia bacterium]
MKSRWTWLALGVVLAVALAIGAQGRSGPMTQAQRVHHIASEIRCPTCRNQSAAESDAAAAKAARDEIDRRLKAGQSEGDILAYFVGRFGSDILLKPEGSGVASLVWILPVVAVVVALGALAFAFTRWRARPGVSVSEEDRALVERELEKA